MASFKLLVRCAALFCLFFSVHLTTSAVTGNPEPRAGCDVFHNVAEQIREHIDEPIPSIGFPPLDPFTMESVDVDLQHPYLKLKGNFKNLRAVDLKYFVISACKVVIFPGSFNLGLRIPQLDVSGNYDFVGNIGDLIKFFGKGPFTILLKGIDVVVSSKIDLGAIKLKDLNIEVTFETFEGNFVGLMDDEELGEVFNELINDIASEAFDILWPDFKPSIEEVVTEMANDMMEGVTYIELLAILNGTKNITLFP